MFLTPSIFCLPSESLRYGYDDLKDSRIGTFVCTIWVLARYLFNECGHTGRCGREGGYSNRDGFEIPPDADLDANQAKAEVMRGYGYHARLQAFGDMVDYKSPWDYKVLGPQYENFGNWHYGYMGAAAGIPDEVLFRAAGYVQRSNSEWFGQKPSLLGVLRGTGGSGYFGDDPKDSYWIRQGINAYRNSGKTK
jgi:hypothetical protein